MRKNDGICRILPSVMTGSEFEGAGERRSDKSPFQWALEVQKISFNTDFSDPNKTRADFIYKITPTLISIIDTGLGQCSVTEDIEAVLRKIEYWRQGSISSFKIMYRDGKGFWHEVHQDGKTASLSPLGETDEQRALKKLPLERRE
jgi:hypothetical protein